MKGVDAHGLHVLHCRCEANKGAIPASPSQADDRLEMGNANGATCAT